MFNEIGGNDDFIIDENTIDFSFEDGAPQDVETIEPNEEQGDDEEKPSKKPKVKEEETEPDPEEEAFDESVFDFQDGLSDDEDEDDNEDDDSDDTSDDEATTKKSTSKKGPKPSSYLSAFNALKDKGIIDYEPEEDEELDEDKAKEVIEDGFDKAVDNKVAEILGDLDDDRKGLIKFIANGGDLKQLSSVVGKQDISAFDISKESDQIKLVRQQLVDNEFGDEEEIDAQIQFYKDRGTLEKQAKKLFEKQKEKSEQEKAKLLEQQAAAREQAKAKAREFKKTLSTVISENEEINDFVFTRKDKDLPDYINDASIKLEGGKTITPFYKDLYTAMQDPKKLVVLAKIVRSGFDFSNIKNKAITAQTDKVRNNLERKESKNNTSAKKSSQKRLIDYLD